jgi:hypothetical protein
MKHFEKKFSKFVAFLPTGHSVKTSSRRLDSTRLVFVAEGYVVIDDADNPTTSVRHGWK